MFTWDVHARVQGTKLNTSAIENPCFPSAYCTAQSVQRYTHHLNLTETAAEVVYGFGSGLW